MPVSGVVGLAEVVSNVDELHVRAGGHGTGEGVSAGDSMCRRYVKGGGRFCTACNGRRCGSRCQCLVRTSAKGFGKLMRGLVM